MMIGVAEILKRELEFGFNLFVVCVNAGFDRINFSIESILVELLGFYFSAHYPIDFVFEFDFRHLIETLGRHINMDNTLREDGATYNYVYNVLFDRYILDSKLYVHVDHFP